MELTPTQLAEQADISVPYASQILSTGEHKRNPSRPLAIHIFRKVGWKHPMLEGLTDDQIATLEAIEPWKPSKEKAA